KTAFTRLTGHARRGRYRPIDGRRLHRPGVQHRALGLSVLATAEHLITHEYHRDSLADLVHHSSSVRSEVTRTGQRLPTGHGPTEHLPVDGVPPRPPHN